MKDRSGAGPKYAVTLPPENYPHQEDYGALTLQGKTQIAAIHDAFLHDRIQEASDLAGDLFQTSYNLLRLCNALAIERNNREKFNQAKYQPTQKELIEASIRRRAEAVRGAAGFYEAVVPGTPTPPPERT